MGPGWRVERGREGEGRVITVLRKSETVTGPRDKLPARPTLIRGRRSDFMFESRLIRRRCSERLSLEPNLPGLAECDRAVSLVPSGRLSRSRPECPKWMIKGVRGDD